MTSKPLEAVRAGHCTACGELIWRSAVAARDDRRQGIKAGDKHILWPRPDSVYAVLETATGTAPGIAYHAACAPPIGAIAIEGFGPVLRYEGARDRYHAWFTTEWGEARRLWLHDALSLAPHQVNALMKQWHLDRG